MAIYLHIIYGWSHPLISHLNANIDMDVDIGWALVIWL